MKQRDILRQRLEEAGWRLVRMRTHQVWRCPCGQHQVTLAMSASDHRAEKNKKAQIRRTGCPSLEGVVI